MTLRILRGCIGIVCYFVFFFFDLTSYIFPSPVWCPFLSALLSATAVGDDRQLGRCKFWAKADVSVSLHFIFSVS